MVPLAHGILAGHHTWIHCSCHVHPASTCDRLPMEIRGRGLFYYVTVIPSFRRQQKIIKELYIILQSIDATAALYRSLNCKRRGRVVYLLYNTKSFESKQISNKYGLSKNKYTYALGRCRCRDKRTARSRQLYP